MRTPLLVLASSLLLVSGILVAPGPGDHQAAASVTDAAVAGAPPPEAARAAGQAMGQVRFEPNQGQAHPDVLFTGRTADGLVLLERDGLTFVADEARVHLAFVGAAPITVTPDGRQGAVSHHYIGTDAGGWLRDVPLYDSIRYTSILPGVDLLVYGTADGRLEFDHIVAPGADPSVIRLHVTGAAPRLDAGALLLDPFRLEAPIAFQGAGQHVPAAFVVDGQDITYELGAYDPALPLTIDPVMKYSSFLGRSSSDYGYDIAVHEVNATHRHIYAAGYTSSTTSLPGGFTTPMIKDHGASGTEAYVAKFTYDRATHQMTPIWYALIGGTGSDYAYGVDVDPTSGDIVLGGYTLSTNFPTLNGIVEGGWDGNVDQNGYDGWLTVLDSNGAMEFSSYLGGYGSDYVRNVAFTPAGTIATTGETTLTVGGLDFPTVNGPMTTRPYTGTDAFVAEVDYGTSPATLVFSTFIGSGSSDYGYGVDADATSIVFGGYTANAAGTPAFPTTAGAYQTTPGAGYAGYVGKIPIGGGSNWEYVTLIDGSSSDYVADVAVDSTGKAWVVGRTYSSNLGVSPNALQGFYSCCSYEGFIWQLSDDGATRPYATYAGGSSSDYLYEVAVDPNDNALVGGYVYNSNFPLSDPVQTSIGGTPEAVIMKIDPAGNYVFGTFLGASGTDDAQGVAGDSTGNIYVTGDTTATAFPTLNPIDGVRSGTDAFLTVYGKTPPLPVITVTAPGYAGMDTPAGPYEVLTFETISIDGLNSTAGAYPLDMPATTWTLAMPGSPTETVTGTLTPSFTTPLVLNDDDVGQVCLELKDMDSDPVDSTASACMDLAWLNRPPVPTIDGIAPNPVQIGASIDLTGSAIDDDGIVVSYAWDLEGESGIGDTATLAVPSIAGVYQVRLNATDDDGLNGTTTMNVTVVDGPIADFTWPAGTYIAGDTVGFEDLSLPGSLPIVNWTWDFGDGVAADFVDPAPPIVSHTYALPGTYDVTLTVDDGTLSASATKQVTIMPDTPIAVPDAYTVFMDTDLDVALPGVLANDIQPYGGPMTVVAHTQPLDGAGAQVATVAIAPDGSFTFVPAAGFIGLAAFEYTINDTYVDAGPGIVTVNVTEFPPPTASFASHVSGTQVVFTDASYIGHWPLGQWSWQFGDGQTAFTRHPVHHYDAPGTYTVTLTVTDEFGLIGTTTRTVFVTQIDRSPPEPGSDPPVAEPGAARVVREGDTVLLDASASAGDLSYAWTQVAGPTVDLIHPDAAHASFIAPAPDGGAATLVFALRVHDGVQFSEPAEVAVIVQARNQPPVARLVEDLMTVAPGSSVLLDGLLSVDPDGDDLTYHWQQTHGPAVDVPASGEQVRFTAPEEGTVLVELTVDDGSRTDTTTAEIRVVPDAPRLDASFEVDVGPDGTVLFHDGTDADAAVQYYWDFGDGSPPSHLATPVHVYDEGTYRVTLLVTDGQGQWSRFARMVSVTHAEAPELDFAASEVEDVDTAPAKDSPVPGALLLIGLVAVLVRRRGAA